MPVTGATAGATTGATTGAVALTGATTGAIDAAALTGVAAVVAAALIFLAAGWSAAIKPRNFAVRSSRRPVALKPATF